MVVPRGSARQITFKVCCSIGPVLFIVVAIAGLVFGEDAAQGAISAQLGSLMGQQSAELLQTAIQNAAQRSTGFLAAAVGIGTLVITASGVFTEMPWQPHFVPENNYLDAWLAHGFAIVATDYQGLGTPGPHPYQIVRAAAYNVLDSIRAVLHSQPSLADRIVVVGFSQGAGAAFAAGGFAPAYAGELGIRGIITTGIPNWTPDVLKAPPPEVIARISEHPDPTVTYNLYIGLVAQQRNPKLPADSLVSARGMPLLDLARVSCVGAMFYNVTMAGLNRANALVPSYLDALARLLPDMEYPTLKLAMPVFVGIGEQDHDVPLSWQLGLAKNACASGTVVETHLYRGMNHVEAIIASLKDLLPFAQKVLNAEAVTPVCEPAPEQP